MGYCNKCKYTSCNCGSVITSSTTINSDQAGREGLSAFESAKRVGEIPINATEQEFIESLKGDKGDPGENGDTLIPELTDNFFDI